MKRKEPVSVIMTKNVHTVNLSDELADVVQTLKKHKIRHIPVVDGKDVVGIISRTDINRLTFGSLFENQDGADEAILSMLSVSQVMSSNPRLVQAATTIREVAEIFTTEEFHALPVTDDQGKLVGIVTTTDIIKYLLDQY
ncbi:MAG: CBS domain-containing protein [Spirosomataceae bacterium]